ncbi:hypothetical protein Q8W13_06310 [Photobacterium damselae subsp. piscicida]|nr:hypothetical protein [Photobacterium damselae subsp. piscicida]
MSSGLKEVKNATQTFGFLNFAAILRSFNTKSKNLMMISSVFGEENSRQLIANENDCYRLRNYVKFTFKAYR